MNSVILNTIRLGNIVAIILAMLYIIYSNPQSIVSILLGVATALLMFLVAYIVVLCIEEDEACGHSDRKKKTTHLNP
jgi:hypothetical protein